MHTSYASCADYSESVWALAESYRQASEYLFDREDAGVITPALYMQCHALELFLKSFLVAKGVSQAELSKSSQYRHDIYSCLKECARLGLCSKLEFLREHLRQVRRISRIYKEKNLEYFYPKEKIFGSISLFREIVKNVSRATVDLMLSETLREFTGAP
ncbi:MAG: hypothetical protein AB7O86_11700 [Porticoccaceae bacterium]